MIHPLFSASGEKDDGEHLSLSLANRVMYHIAELRDDPHISLGWSLYINNYQFLLILFVSCYLAVREELLGGGCHLAGVFSTVD